MREIKFRAYDKKEKKWIDPITNQIAVDLFDGELYYDCRCIGADAFLVPHNKEDIHLMQYTGLKDKNGKDIYEGDIVKFKGKNFQIGWNNFLAGFYRIPLDFNVEKMIKGKDKGRVYNLQDIEVIGNIYENSVLVEDKE